jgi:CheY-like chemotaxis protein/HPt (histidine-containing phosphotransfer) domain-containing protein
MGYRADVAANGLEVLESIQRQRYNIILMDMQMPEMDGLAATRYIVSEWKEKRPRIIAMTANAMQEDREACLAAGMDDYISKPVQVNELQEAILRWGSPTGATGLQTESAKPLETVPVNLPDAVDQKVLAELRSLQMPDEPDIIQKFFEIFKHEVPTLIASMREAVSRSDAALLRISAHSIKGSSAGLGAKYLSSLSAEIEKAGKNGLLVEVEKIDEVDREFHRVLKTMGFD